MDDETLLEAVDAVLYAKENLRRACPHPVRVILRGFYDSCENGGSPCPFEAGARAALAFRVALAGLRDNPWKENAEVLGHMVDTLKAFEDGAPWNKACGDLLSEKQ